MTILGIKFTKNKLGIEDLEIGTDVVEQMRGKQPINITQINGANFPYDATYTMKSRIDALQIQLDNQQPVIDQDGHLLTGLINTSALDLNLTGRLWRKDKSPTVAEMYYGVELLYRYNPTDGNLILPVEQVGDMFKSDSLSGLADYGIARSNLGLEIGSNVQAYDTTLQSLADSEGEGTVERLGNGSISTYTVTAQGKALLDDVDASAQRTTLGLGTGATLNADNTANNLVKLDGDGKIPELDASNLTNVPVDSGQLDTQLESKLGFNSLYESPQTIIVANSVYTFTHELGLIPFRSDFELVCIASDLGYSEGDRITPANCWSANVGGFNLWYNDTQVGVSIYYTPAVVTKGGSFGYITLSKWKLIVKAWA